jgi:ATP-dependent Lhr-like helicase
MLMRTPGERRKRATDRNRALLTLRAAADLVVAEAAVRALATLVGEGRLRALELVRVDGVPVAESPLRESLAAAGFRASYRGWVLRAQAR